MAHAAQMPVNDPMMLVSAMAAVTQHLGFGVTSNLSFEPPYPFARRMSTLDHLTNGRIGWNIVTGYLDSAARGAGREKQTAHDDRYAIAEEYLEVVYKLWEGGWADDAVKADAATRLRRPGARAKVRASRRAFQRGRACISASPRRSARLCSIRPARRRRAASFAARHAECVFMSGPSAAVIAPRVAAIRAGAERVGRRRSDILIFSMATAILAAERRGGAGEARGLSRVTPISRAR